MKVIIDGTERTVNTTKANFDLLAANVGKLFEVTKWEDDNNNAGYYGFVRTVALVNEASDNNSDFDKGDVDYVSASALGISGNTLDSDSTSWTITADTKFINVDGVNKIGLSDIDLDDDGIWVVAANGNNGAAYVYVGEKLDESVALTVTATNGTTSLSGTTWSFNSNKDATNVTFTYTANDDNSVILYNCGGERSATKTATATHNKAGEATTKTVTVWNEAGTDHETYTINLTWNEKSTDATLAGVTVNNGAPIEVKDPGGTANEATITYLDATGNFTFYAQATSTIARVQIGKGENVAAATSVIVLDSNTGYTESVNVSLSTPAEKYIVVKVTAESGTVKYYVFCRDSDPTTTYSVNINSTSTMYAVVGFGSTWTGQIKQATERFAKDTQVTVYVGNKSTNTNYKYYVTINSLNGTTVWEPRIAYGGYAEYTFTMPAEAVNITVSSEVSFVS